MRWRFRWQIYICPNLSLSSAPTAMANVVTIRLPLSRMAEASPVYYNPLMGSFVERDGYIFQTWQLIVHFNFWQQLLVDGLFRLRIHCTFAFSPRFHIMVCVSKLVGWFDLVGFYLDKNTSNNRNNNHKTCWRRYTSKDEWCLGWWKIFHGILPIF